MNIQRFTMNRAYELEDLEPVLSLSGGTEGFYTYKLNGVDMVICPFNRAHMLRAKRLQYHLQKCIKQYTGNKVACPYNVTEFVEVEDFQKHLEVCDSRSRFYVNLWNSDRNREKNTHVLPSPPIDLTVPYDVEEYW